MINNIYRTCEKGVVNGKYILFLSFFITVMTLTELLKLFH
jgi:hypothetical protein